ncbi:MAG: preprotein translocase subunit YajC [Eubacterium sp.]|nr:preprotein translocase subunit YajC [Eubacterium sp.]
MTDLITILSSGQTATGAAGDASPASMLVMLIPLVLMIVIFYFLIIRPEKKRSKQMKQMLDNLEVADEVVTAGGIIGRVLSVKEDTVLIETGSDRTKIRILKSSIAENRTVHDTQES